jgi:hypothetical protein
MLVTAIVICQSAVERLAVPPRPHLINLFSEPCVWRWYQFVVKPGFHGFHQPHQESVRVESAPLDHGRSVPYHLVTNSFVKQPTKQTSLNGPDVPGAGV